MVDRFDGSSEMQPYVNGDYVRYSDYAALKAENERLTNEYGNLKKGHEETLDRLGECLRALAERAGGVSITKDEAQKLCDRLEYDASWDKCGSGYYSMKRQLSALTTEPAAPEGRQEAVAFASKRDMQRLQSRRAASVHPSRHASTDTPLYTRPAEQAVTDEMVEAAQDAWEEADNDTGDLDACWRAALKAAMEAGR